jgi:hypothetical protein
VGPAIHKLKALRLFLLSFFLSSNRSARRLSAPSEHLRRALVAAISPVSS